MRHVFPHPNSFPNSFRDALLARIHADPSANLFQNAENYNAAARAEYALALHRESMGFDDRDAAAGGDIKSLITDLCHAARYRNIDPQDLSDLITAAHRMWADEVIDEE